MLMNAAQLLASDILSDRDFYYVIDITYEKTQAPTKFAHNRFIRLTAHEFFHRQKEYGNAPQANVKKRDKQRLMCHRESVVMLVK